MLCERLDKTTGVGRCWLFDGVGGSCSVGAARWSASGGSVGSSFWLTVIVVSVALRLEGLQCLVVVAGSVGCWTRGFAVEQWTS